jgi:hypothetical protein
MQGNLNPFDLLSTNMLHVQPDRKNTIDQLYFTQRDAYKALPQPPFDKSDHNSILLIPVYKQKLKQEVPVTRSIRKWPDDADAKLRTVLLAQTVICSGNLPMALRSTPRKSLAMTSYKP